MVEWVKGQINFSGVLLLNPMPWSIFVGFREVKVGESVSERKK